MEEGRVRKKQRVARSVEPHSPCCPQLQGSALRWALQLTLGFLERRDVARLAVCAFEIRDASLGHWLLYGDAFPWTIDEASCLHIPVAETCWVAADTLLKSRRRAKRLRKHGVRPPVGSAQFERFLSVHRPIAYVFPAEVLYQRSGRGDLAVVQWLHATCEYKPHKALHCAAQGGHFELVEWLVDNNKTAKWALRRSESGDLNALCWYCKDRVKKLTRCCALTKSHGYLTFKIEIGKYRSSPREYRLADPFAECGDLVSLQKIAALGNARQYIRELTVRTAAAYGHLAVVQWLLTLDFHK